MKKYCVYVRNCKNILKGVLKYVKLRGYNILLLAVWSEIEHFLHKYKCEAIRIMLQVSKNKKIAQASYLPVGVFTDWK